MEMMTMKIKKQQQQQEKEKETMMSTISMIMKKMLYG